MHNFSAKVSFSVYFLEVNSNYSSIRHLSWSIKEWNALSVNIQFLQLFPDSRLSKLFKIKCVNEQTESSVLFCRNFNRRSFVLYCIYASYLTGWKIQNTFFNTSELKISKIYIELNFKNSCCYWKKNIFI